MFFNTSLRAQLGSCMLSAGRSGEEGRDKSLLAINFNRLRENPKRKRTKATEPV